MPSAERLLRLYPRAWRERFGEEFLETAGPGKLRFQQVIDIVSGAIDAWLSAAPAVLLDPTPDHASVLRSLLITIGTGGNLVNDAHLAALAIEHRCTVVSFDNDFGRFPAVRWELPPA